MDRLGSFSSKYRVNKSQVNINSRLKWKLIKEEKHFEVKQSPVNLILKQYEYKIKIKSNNTYWLPAEHMTNI